MAISSSDFEDEFLEEIRLFEPDGVKRISQVMRIVVLDLREIVPPVLQDIVDALANGDAANRWTERHRVDAVDRCWDEIERRGGQIVGFGDRIDCALKALICAVDVLIPADIREIEMTGERFAGACYRLGFRSWDELPKP